MKKKRALLLLLTALMVMMLFAGCGSSGNKDSSASSAASSSSSQAEQTSGKLTFTDQADRKVTVQLPVKRMVVLQHHSIDILCQLGAQDKIVGVESKWEGDLGDYIKTVFPEIENMETPGDLTSWNVEQIASLKPDVVIAASQADEDAIQKVEDLGIPVVVVSLRSEGRQKSAQSPELKDADKAYTEGCEWAVKTLGRLAGKSEKADELWNFCMESRKMVSDAVGDIKDSDKVTSFAACEGDQTYGDDKYVGCMLNRAGGVNVAAKDIKGYKSYSMEQLAVWDPEVIFVQDRYKDVYDSFTTDSKYSFLQAVKNKKVILAPYWTKPWGNPDADSIALGELWMAHQFYPDKISADTVKERADKFYKEFYGTEFTGTVE